MDIENQNENLNYIRSIIKDLAQKYYKTVSFNQQNKTHVDAHSFLTINNPLYDIWTYSLKRCFAVLSPWYQIITNKGDYKEAFLNLSKLKPEIINERLENDDFISILNNVSIKDFFHNKTINHQSRIIFELSENKEKIVHYYELLTKIMMNIKEEGIYCNKNIDKLVGERVSILPNTYQCFFQNLISIIAEILRRVYNNKENNNELQDFIKEEEYEGCTLKIYKLLYNNHSQTSIIEYYFTASALCCMLFDPITAQFFLDLSVPHIIKYYEPKLLKISDIRLKRSFLSISRAGDAFILSHLLTGLNNSSDVLDIERNNLFEVVNHLHDTKPNFIGMFNGDVQYFGVFGDDLIWSQQYDDVIYVSLFDFNSFMEVNLFDNEKKDYIKAKELNYNDYVFFGKKKKYCFDSLTKSFNLAEKPIFNQRMSFYFNSNNIPEKLAPFADVFIPMSLLRDGKLISTVPTQCSKEDYAEYLSYMKYTSIKMHK